MSQPLYEPFSCEVQTKGAAAHVLPAGELDILSTPQLQQRLSQLRADGCKAIVLDLREVSFLDSTALHLLSQWTDASNLDGFDFSVRLGSPHHRRLVELTGLAAKLHLVADADGPTPPGGAGP